MQCLLHQALVQKALPQQRLTQKRLPSQPVTDQPPGQGTVPHEPLAQQRMSSQQMTHQAQMCQGTQKRLPSQLVTDQPLVQRACLSSPWVTACKYPISPGGRGPCSSTAAHVISVCESSGPSVEGLAPAHICRTMTVSLQGRRPCLSSPWRSSTCHHSL